MFGLPPISFILTILAGVGAAVWAIADAFHVSAEERLEETQA